MTTKTIKTILFAGLIAAMILPFSGMQIAEAEQAKTEQKIDAKKLRQMIDSEIATEKDSKVIDRYSKIKQLVDLKEKIQNSNNELEIEKLNESALDIIKELNNSYDNEEQEIATTDRFPINQVSGGNYVSFSAQQHRQPDCGNPNHDYAWQDGDGEATSTKTVIDVSLISYPTSVATGVIGNCTSHNDDFHKSTLSGPTGICNIFVNPSAGSYEATCNTIKWNQIVIVTTQGNYGGYTEEYASEGWTIMSTF